jgi:cytochrome c
MLKTKFIAAGLLIGTSSAFADGEALYTAKMCMTCHGAEGKAPIMATYPKLAGQNAAYCESQVKDIRDDKRTNGMTMAMKPMVAAVTDAEITEICAYLASD